MERTLIILKPDAVQRQLMGEIISRFERKGLKLVAAKFILITEEQARRHYAIHKGKPFYEGLVKYLSSSPSMVMVFQADGVIDMVRKMLGATIGQEAAAGTIRGDFGCSRGYNVVHGSDSPETAEMEIGLFFSEKEMLNYRLADEDWLYGRND